MAGQLSTSTGLGPSLVVAMEGTLWDMFFGMFLLKRSMNYCLSIRRCFYNQNHVPFGNQSFSQTYQTNRGSQGFWSDPQYTQEFSSTQRWLKAVSWQITRESQAPCKNSRIKFREVYPNENPSQVWKISMFDFNRVKAGRTTSTLF